MNKRHCADDFAICVDRLYAHALAGKPFDAKRERREVCEVAFALAQLRNLVNSAVKQTKLKQLPETALVAASDLLDALMNGTEHPVWRYIEESKPRKRKYRAPASAIDNMRRGLLIGILRSLRFDTSPQLSRRAAAQRIVDHQHVLGATLTADQIIGWDKAFAQRQDRLPDAVRTDIASHAGGKSTQDEILKVGLGRAYFLWALPNGVS